MTSGWPLLPSGSGLTSLRTALGLPRRSRGLISPCFYPGFTPIVESEVLTIGPNQGSSQAEGHGFDPRRPLQLLVSGDLGQPSDETKVSPEPVALY